MELQCTQKNVQTASARPGTPEKGAAMSNCPAQTLCAANGPRIVGIQR